MYAEIISMKIEKYLTVQDLTYLKKLVDHSNRIKLADICSSDLKILSVLKEAEGTIAVL